MADIAADTTNLINLTIPQLRAITADFRQPPEVTQAAQALLEQLVEQDFRAAVATFVAATPTFVNLTSKLLDITEKARANPVGDAVAVITPLLRRAGELFDAVGDLAHEALPAATRDAAEDLLAVVEDVATAAAAALGAAPPAGSARASTTFSEIAGEYAATFAAMVIRADRQPTIDKLVARIVAFRARYEEVGAKLNIPWHFIGIVHSMECSCNFGLHLHNGDTLMHRTARVPSGRPTPAVADPPFAWSTSAIDALTLKGLNTKTDWSLAAQLYRLEQFNGFGYRRRGLATPYLWSFSSHYTKGKFVKDHVFDPEALSAQCGGAVLLKQMIAVGAVPPPA